MAIFLILLFVLNGSMSWAQLLSDSIPYPFYDVQDKGENQVMAINDGMAALELRIQMIRKAQKRIEVEYFIFNDDMAGKVIARELIGAAHRGVKVRVLIDKAKPVFRFNESFAKAMYENGVEVRYYNSVPIYRLSTVQYRNHRKLLSIDDHEAITGGRNIGEDYYDLSVKFNFNDRDIYVKGPIAQTMRRSFDEFFEHKISERPKFPATVSKDVDSFFQETAQELEIRNRASIVGGKILSETKLHHCPVTTFSTDAPGADFRARWDKNFDMNFKFLRKTLHDKIMAIDKSLLISSPYMINNKHTRKAMNHLLDKGVKIDIYTNSLASTDAVYVAANLYVDVFKWRRKGIGVYLHDGKWFPENEETPEEFQQAKWGSHDKTQVYETTDYSEVMIGTYNMDNRSNFYNAEMALFCRGNDEFSKEVTANIMNRIKNGLIIHENKTATDRNGKRISVYGTTKEDLLLMRAISLPSWLLRFLL
jgi:cardiolipin synthase C